MNTNGVASYWSATANVGRTEPQAPVPSSVSASYWSNPARNGAPSRPSNTVANQPASYWSATASIGVIDRVSLSETVGNGVFYNRRNVPQVRNRGDAGSAYRTQQTIADLAEKRTKTPLQVKLDLGDPRSIDTQKNFFTRLQDSLRGLSDRLNALASPDAFSPYAAGSTRPDVVTATAGVTASTGAFDVVVSRLAQQHRIASDAVTDAYAAQGLTGSFTVNGGVIEVTAADSLATIADKINFGEDTNKNGTLDRFNEDLNGNGQLDVYYVPAVYTTGGWQKAFTYYEDINNNGVIDTGEDANGNDQLDGGTAKTGVEATVVDNRLLITSLAGGDRSLTVTDPHDILSTLGFYRVNEDTSKVLRSADENSYNRDPAAAEFTIGGEAMTAPFNTVSNVVDGLTIELKGTSTRAATITVVVNSAAAADKIEALAISFNSVISVFSAESAKKSPIQENVRVQDLMTQMSLDAHRTVPSLPNRPSSLSDVGLPPGGAPWPGYDPATLDQLNRRTQRRNPFSTAPLGQPAMPNGDPGLLAKLSRMGLDNRGDLTLAIDRPRLEATLKEDPQGMYQLFNTRPDGVVARLSATIAAATGEPNGVIAYQRSRLDHYASNRGEVQRIMANEVATHRNNLRQASTSTIFTPLSAAQETLGATSPVKVVA